MTSPARSRRMASSLTVAVLFLIAFILLPSASAQSESAPGSTLQRRIHDQLVLAQNPTGSNRDQAARWALLGAEYSEAAQFTDAENAYNHAIQLFSLDPADAELHAQALDQLAALYRIYDRLPEALNCTRLALAVRTQNREPLSSALSQSHLAEVLLTQRKYKEAFTNAENAYQTMAQQPAVSKTDLLSVIIVRSYALCGLRKHAACLAGAEQALAVSRGTFPADSQPVGAALAAVGSAQFAGGSFPQAAESFAHALDIFKVQLASNDPRFLYALQRYRDCLRGLHREEEARNISEQLTILSHQPPGPCPGCTVSGYALRALVK